MKFQTKSSGGGGGYIQDKPLIMGVEVKYNEVNTALMKPFDVQLIVSLEKPTGRDFEPKIYVEGNFDRSATNEVVGDKDMYKVRQLLYAGGITEFEVTTEGKFADGFFDQLIGKRIALIKYIYGTKKDDAAKAAWKNWWKVVPETEAPAQLAEFLKKTSNASVKGFIKDFKPNAADGAKSAAAPVADESRL